MKNKKLFIGIGIFIVLIILIIVIKNIGDSGNIGGKKLIDVYVATGGGKEDFLSDEEVIKILKNLFIITS